MAEGQAAEAPKTKSYNEIQRDVSALEKGIERMATSLETLVNGITEIGMQGIEMSQHVAAAAVNRDEQLVESLKEVLGEELGARFADAWNRREKEREDRAKKLEAVAMAEADGVSRNDIPVEAVNEAAPVEKPTES